MKKILQNASIVSVGLLTPFFAFAQSGVLNLLNQVQVIISAIIPVLIGLALLAFMFGVLKYIFGKKEEGKTTMLWGIVALFVMTSVWGLVSIVRTTIVPDGATNQLRSQDIPQAPRFIVGPPSTGGGTGGGTVIQ